MVSIADQGISSLSNFGIAFLSAISLSAVEFGAFASAYLIYAIAVAGAQAVVSQELVLQTGSVAERAQRAREATRFTLVIGVGLSAALFAAALLTNGALRAPVAVLALTLPILLAQDTLRHAAALTGRLHLALISDVAWLVLAVGSIWVVRTTSIPNNASAFLLSWAAAGCISALVLIRALRGSSSRARLERFRSRGYLGYRFVWEFVALRASSQGLTLLLGALAGLTATGGVRGATTLFGPLTVALLATSSFGVPVVRAVAPARRELALLGIGLLLVSACAGLAALLLLLPADAGRHVLGDTWGTARQFIPPLTVQTACTAVSTVTFLAIRMISPRSTLRLRLLPAIALPAGFFVGYGAAGAAGAMWGIAFGSALQSVVAVLAYARMRSGGASLRTVFAADGLTSERDYT